MSEVSERSAVAAAKLTRARRLLAGAPVLLIGGLAIAGSGNQTLGGVVLLAGWGSFVYALHLFGRTGLSRSTRG